MKKWILFSIFTSLIFSTVAWADDSPILKKVDSISVKKGYIDDQFSISSNGKYLVYITLAARGTAKLHIKSLSKRTEKIVEITKITDEPHKLFFMNNKYVTLVVLNGKYKDFYFFNLQGKNIGQIKGVSDLIHKHAASEITTFKKISRSSSTRYILKKYKIPKFKKEISKARLSTSAGETFMLKKQKLKVSYFSPNYQTAVVRVVGGYDKESDSRLPDKIGFYNLETKKLRIGNRIANNVKWDKDAYQFQKHSGHTNVIQIKGVPTVEGIKGIFRVSTGPQQWIKVKPQFKLGRFNFSSLKVEKRATKRKLNFSLIIDPQNPIILKKLKSEKRFIHFFDLNTNSGKAVDLGRIKVKRGFVRWRINNGILLLMRLSKNWTVGANQLELYKIKK